MIQPPIDWLESNYFHNREKGCKIQVHSVPEGQCINHEVKSEILVTSKKGNTFIKYAHYCPSCKYLVSYRCKTHHVKVCRGDVKGHVCGWQFGKHYLDSNGNEITNHDQEE